MKTQTILLTALSAISLTTEAAAEPAVLVETDPATFALDGFAAHIRTPVTSSERLVLGLGMYGMTYPSFMVGLNPNNRGEGWRQHLDIGLGAFADYHFGDGARGFFTGLQLAHQRFEVTRTGEDGVGSFAAGLAMARFGYLWHPSRKLGFYLMPWAGVGGTVRLYGDANVGGEDFDLMPVIGFATVHAGWRF